MIQFHDIRTFQKIGLFDKLSCRNIFLEGVMKINVKTHPNLWDQMGAVQNLISYNFRIFREIDVNRSPVGVKKELRMQLLIN